ILQAGQQASQQITFIEHTLEDDKGYVHIVRTPINLSNVRAQSPAQVGGQAQLTQSTPLLPPHSSTHVSSVLNSQGLRVASHQASASLVPSRSQGTRLQRNSPLQRLGTPVLQQQQQSQDEHQASYQDQYLKQLENRLHTQQKGSGRGKVTGVHVTQPVVCGATSILSTSVASQSQEQQQKQIPPQATTPSKKLSLSQYRQRMSHELKHQQQQQQQHHKLVGPAQVASCSEEVRIPVSTNNALKQQYYYVERPDGKKVLAVIPMGHTITTTVAQHTHSPTLSTITTAVSTNLSTSSAGGNPVLTVKHEDGVVLSGTAGTNLQSSSTGSTLASPSITVSSSGVGSTNSTSVSSPIQEQSVHSTVPAEQKDKDPTDKPRYIAGRVAVCSNCGILSEDLNRCQRCNHRLPNSVRTLPSAQTTTSIKTSTSDSQAISNRGISLPVPLSKQEFYGKTGGGARKGVEKKSASPATQKSKGRGRGRGKAFEEPVILTLSSDEEDEGGGSSGSAYTGGSHSPQAGQQFVQQEPISQKEPIITQDMENFDDTEEADIGAVTGGGLPDLQSLLDGTLKRPYTSVQCRSIRVGSYKVMPKERVLIVPEGFRIKIPPITDDSGDSVTFDIPIKSVVKILVHLGRSLPVFFIYIKPSTAASVRRLLKMMDKSGYYFDPCSNEESQRRITILPDRMTEENKNLVKEILSSTNVHTSDAVNVTSSVPNDKINIMEELDQREANEILVRSSPMEVQSLVKKTVSSTTSESKMLLIYPPPPQKGGISISTDDYCCLEEEQFLNDVIIDFYLKWLLQSKLSEIHRVHTHVFSTFFYKRLTSKPKKRRLNAPEDDPKLSAAEKRHARVKSWTKSVDIFSKDFIIIPINEHAHWFLAIICFPGLDSPVRMSDGQPVPNTVPDIPKRLRSSKPKNRIEIPVIDDGEWSDRDEAEGDEDELEEDEEEDEETPPNKKSKVDEQNSGECQSTKLETAQPVSIKQPCILIFDSLTGANRARIVATLRDYLMVEHRLRKGTEKVYNRDTMKGACPRVPQQTNYSDCGIYTLQFAESFFEHPLKDYTFPIRTLTEWFPQEVVRGKREAIAKLIANLMEQHNPNHSFITLPDIYFSSDDKIDKGGASVTHAVATPVAQDSPSVENNSVNKINVNSEQSVVPAQDSSKTEKVIESEESASEGVGSSKEQKQSIFNNFSPNTINVNTSCEAELKLHKEGESSVLAKSLSSPASITSVKTLPNKPVSVKSPVNVESGKCEPTFSLPTSQLNIKKYSNPAYSYDKSVPSQKTNTHTISPESHNNVKRQIIYESDESIFPVKGDKKKAPTKENSIPQIKETNLVTELNARNKSGLNFLQSVYNDDSLDEGSRINSNKTESQFNGDNSVSYGIKNTYNPDVSAVHGHGVYGNKLIKERLKITENKTKLVNGTVETVTKGDQSVQGESNTQAIQPSSVMFDKAKSLYPQASSVSRMASPPKYTPKKNSNISLQGLGTSKAAFSSNSVTKSFAQSVSTVQTRRVPASGKTAFSSSSGIVSEELTSNPVKTGQRAIIDRDTAEVLLIMNPASPVSSNSTSNKPSLGNSPTEQQNIFIDEDSNYGNLACSDRQSVRTVSTPTTSRPVLSSTHDRGCHTSSLGRRSGSEYVTSVPLGSSSPTLTGTSTPAVFRFNERVTSSGRTIAPPKRYLDDDDDTFSKKRRDKSAQGKPRSIVR
ncbi:hypothetical protein OTU49_002576, partial [Cherax quadricarinatus]